MRYAEAIPLLKKQFKREKSRTEKGKIAFMLAESYSATGDIDEGAVWFRNAYDNNYGPEALERLAECQMQTEQYEEAYKTYKEFGIEIGSKYQVRKQLQAAEKAKNFDQSKAFYKVEKVNIANHGSIYAPAFWTENKALVTAEKKEDENSYAWTGRGYTDLFTLNTSTNELQPLSTSINGEYNDANAAMHPDKETMILTKCEPFADQAGYCKLYVATFDGSTWQLGKQLPFQEEGYNYTQPAFSEDGSILYYSSDHADAVGGYDIFFVEFLPGGELSEQTRLPRTVNTQGNEHYPSVRKDTLYFSSDGKPGFGGLDIFKVYSIGTNNWSTAKNLNPPINSGGDDFGISFKPNTPTNQLPVGLFSSNRKSNTDHIYAFNELPKPEVPEIKETIEVDSGKIILQVTVVSDVKLDPSNYNSKVLGVKPLESAALKSIPETTDLKLKSIEPGVWTTELTPNKNYQFFASAANYLSSQGNVSTQNMRRSLDGSTQELELEIKLDKIERGREIVIKDIYYDFNKASIREDAKANLNGLVNILNLNPNLRVQLNAHTDCRGRAGYNQNLSQQRANSAVNYLIEQGIDAERLVAKGYGENSPIEKCNCNDCSEEQHQRNRRTTFTILE